MKIKFKLLSILTLFLASIILLADTTNSSLSTSLKSGQTNSFTGPYSLESAVFFIDHNGGPLKIDISIKLQASKLNSDPRSSVTPSLLATLYNPDEKVTQDFYWRQEKGSIAHTLSASLYNAPAGIWQLRITRSRGSKLSYNVMTEPSSQMAIMPSRCWIWFKDLLTFKNAYFMAPNNTKAPLELFAKGNVRAEIQDNEGMQVANVYRNSQKISLEPGMLYQLKIKTDDPRWAWVGIGNAPIILCPTLELAKKLYASQVILPDGTTVPMKFHQRVVAWKQTLTPKDLAVDIVDLTQFKELFAGDRSSAALLEIRGALSAAEYLLSIQDINPTSANFGSAPRNLGALAVLYSTNKPYNPYYKNKAILKRILLYFLTKLTASLHENGTIYETCSSYAGGDAMANIQDYYAFMLVANDLQASERELWEEGLAYPLRRFYTDRVTCENQSAHWPMKLYAFFIGSGNQLFKQLAENFVKDMTNITYDRFIRTGYLQESYGPDATYQGLCTSVIAFYYHLSGDENAKNILKNIYNLMNHTVAPEPDGTIYGSSGFSHRTRGSWAIKQYGGGTRLIANELNEAACWHRNPEKPWNPTTVQQCLSWIKNDAMAYYKDHSYVINYGFGPFGAIWYSLPAKQIKKNSKFPVEESEYFNHIFNNEFHFIRRKNYYATFYTGNTAAKHVSWEKNKTPFGCKWEEKQGVMQADKRKIFSAIPGLQLYWTPSYGTALVSMNWSLYTQQTTRLEKADSSIDWISYWDSNAHYNQNNQLIMKQPFLNSPVSLERIVTCKDNSVNISLTLTAKNSNDTIAIEQFPYIEKKGMRVEFRTNSDWKQLSSDNVNAIRWININGNGVRIDFTRNINIKQGKTYIDQNVKIGTLNAVIGDFSNKILKLDYTISSF